MTEALNLKIEQESLLNPQYQQSNQKTKILIVEDDLTIQPLWRAIVEKAEKNSSILWAHSEDEAENLIQSFIKNRQELDLVITDIFLSGPKTGIELWKRYAKELKGRMILTSGIEYQKFIQFFKNEQQRPIFLQKPLIIHECICAIYTLLRENKKTESIS